MKTEGRRNQLAKRYQKWKYEPLIQQAMGIFFTDHLVEHLALCGAPQLSSPDPSTLVVLSAVRATSDHVHAGAQAVLTGPCGPKKTQEIPIEVCPDNQKANLVII